jgi:hypothetical protein
LTAVRAVSSKRSIGSSIAIASAGNPTDSSKKALRMVWRDVLLETYETFVFFNNQSTRYSAPRTFLRASIRK